MPRQRLAHLHQHINTMVIKIVFDHFLLSGCSSGCVTGPFCLYLASAEQNWLWLMTFLHLIGWFSHDSVPDAIPEGITNHSSCRETSREVQRSNQSQWLTSESRQKQNYPEWSSGLRLHLWFLQQNCDPELVYMSLPETQKTKWLFANLETTHHHHHHYHHHNLWL